MERSIAVYRTIRRVTPPDSPYAGRLVADGDTVVVLVDVESLGSGWVGWARDPDAHLCTPLDVARGSAGHDVVLPWCSERLDRYLDRREHSPVTGGEAVTLLVSALRAVHAARDGVARTERGPNGTWWLTDAGRPLFCDGGTEPIESATATVARRIANTTQDRVIARIAGDISDLLADVSAIEGDRLEACERRLFTACAARPLLDPVAMAGGELPGASERSPHLGDSDDAARARSPHFGDRSLSTIGRRPRGYGSGATGRARDAERRPTLVGIMRERWGLGLRALRLPQRGDGREPRGQIVHGAPVRARRATLDGLDRGPGPTPRDAATYTTGPASGRTVGRLEADGDISRRWRVRGAPLLVGAAAAASVLTIGLLWPM